MAIPYDAELPRHKTLIQHSFFMGMYEVTVGEFTKFVEASGFHTEAEKSNQGGLGFDSDTGLFSRTKAYTWRNPGWAQDENHPVVNLSWNDAVSFARWLSDKEHMLYRLPTEAEWEYACRAGTQTRFWTGNDDSSLEGAENIADSSLDNFSKRVQSAYDPIFQLWNDESPFTSPVGSFAPNPFLIYDMHGNVSEWCDDWFDPAYYRTTLTANPTGPSHGVYRAFRGGNFYSSPRNCRSSTRNASTPDFTSCWLGFRLVAIPP